MPGTYKLNDSRTVIKVQFPSRPSAEFRGILKDAGFKWVPKEQLWRAANTLERLRAAQRVADPDREVPQGARPMSFSFGDRLDTAQKAVVIDTEGPVLVVAGPGAGKTSTMVKRISYLVQVRGVPPEQIMVATYTRKAAKELLTRISNEFSGMEHPVNVDKMLIGTFHSLCQRLLSDYADRAGMKNFTVLEEFDQLFMVEYGRQFGDLRQADLFKTPYGHPIKGAKYAGRFVTCANTLSEECVATGDLASCKKAGAAELARFVEQYRCELVQRNQIDYAGLQVRLLDLLRNDPQVLAELREKISYIIVDEYQDANFIQEQIVLLLAGSAQNVCVVGDDDQSLYRFRGATVQNILQFESNFTGDKRCRRHDLVVNYRSQVGIVDFCRRWISSMPRYEGDATWGGCRYDKAIAPNPKFDPAGVNAISVVRCDAPCENAWRERMLHFVRDIQRSDQFADLNQIAFLCSSVKSTKIQNLIAYFEGNGVPVNAPRANMFFRREEVRVALGCLMRCFPSCDNPDMDELDGCCMAADDALSTYPELAAWVKQRRQVHERADEKDRLGYAFSDLFYQMLCFEPFRGWLDKTDSSDMLDSAQARNLSLVVSICSRFEVGENFVQFTGRSVKTMPLRFFKRYLPGIIDSGVEEYEDEREYAPSGKVSFMTVHQAKGMEFPVVVVCSLEDEPWGDNEPLVDAIRSLNRKRDELERPEDRANFDFWRKYYTAFSRAQDLLVLTTAGSTKTPWGRVKPDPSECFASLAGSLPSVERLDFPSLKLRKVKPANIMRTYAFTSDVASYQACPRRYKFFHELGFPQASGKGMLFGTLVHQCVEDIHRIVKRRRDAGEDVSRLYIPPQEVRGIVTENRIALERAENTYLRQMDDEVMKQVLKYLKHSKSIWRDVVEPEAAVSEVRDGFALKGVVDLIHGSDDCVEVVDFKTGVMPKEGSSLLQKYLKQMLIYVHLVRTQLGCEVSGAKLYFTGDKTDRPVIDVALETADIEALLHEFDQVVKRIEACDFSAIAQDEAECRGCPLSGYCGRV